MAQTFTTDQVRRAIKSCRNSKAFGPDKLSIFHLKHLGPRAIEYITTLFSLSVTTCRIPAIWKSSLIIPIHKPGKVTSIGTSYLASLPSGESTGVSDSAHYQQIYPACSRSARFSTRSLDQPSSTADDNRHRNGIQPEEAPRSNGLRSCKFIGCA